MDLRPLGIAIALLGLGSSIVLTELQVEAEGMNPAQTTAAPMVVTLKPSKATETASTGSGCDAVRAEKASTCAASQKPAPSATVPESNTAVFTQ